MKLFKKFSSLLLVLLFAGNANAECKIQSLDVHGSEVQIGDLVLNLGEANNSEKPTAWQGPLVSGECKMDLSIIEKPLVLVADSYLYVPTYSGSNQNLSVVDLKKCSVVWKSEKFSGAVKINSTGIKLGKKYLGLGKNCLPKQTVK